ncbi:MAG: hypothetical protein OQK79_02485 [Rhodanobacter sp.]|nr:hypothetical protein [Rhodanobacter sp.]
MLLVRLRAMGVGVSAWSAGGLWHHARLFPLRSTEFDPPMPTITMLLPRHAHAALRTAAWIAVQFAETAGAPLRAAA